MVGAVMLSGQQLHECLFVLACMPAAFYSCRPRSQSSMMQTPLRCSCNLLTFLLLRLSPSLPACLTIVYTSTAPQEAA